MERACYYNGVEDRLIAMYNDWQYIFVMMKPYYIYTYNGGKI